MDDPDEWYARSLSEHLEMNARTWATLQQQGVGAESALRLDFFFEAPDRAAAEELATFLARQTDYELSTTADESIAEGLGWLVRGRTRPSRVSAAILDEWVTFMIRAGAEHGRCVFDGWGTPAPGQPTTTTPSRRGP